MDLDSSIFILIINFAQILKIKWDTWHTIGLQLKFNLDSNLIFSKLRLLIIYIYIYRERERERERENLIMIY